MRENVAQLYISLGFLALCVGAYIDVSYPSLLVCAFWIAGTSFYKAYKIDANAIGISIIGAIITLVLILEKVIIFFA